MAAPTEIYPCPISLRADALKLVLRELLPEQQFATVKSLAPAKAKSLGPFDALFIATRGEQLAAAVWGQPQAGRVATLWPPKFAGARDERLAVELIDVAARRTGQFDTAMLQAIIELTDAPTANLLRRARFAHVADLAYLEWLPRETEQAALPTPQLETYRSGLKERIKQVLSQTYIGSLDCPQLDSLRSLDDVIDGYQATGDFDPSMWLLAASEGQDVGVLLLTPYQETRQIELIYMGVVPQARGQGIGAALLQHAQTLAIEWRAKRLLLAVDAANIPARTLYHRAGFREWSQRSVYIRAFRSDV